MVAKATSARSDGSPSPVADAKAGGADDDGGSIGGSSKSSAPSYVEPEAPQALVAVLNLGAFDIPENGNGAALSQTQASRTLRQFGSVAEYTAAQPRQNKLVWVDLSTESIDDIKLLAAVRAPPTPLFRVFPPCAPDLISTSLSAFFAARRAERRDGAADRAACRAGHAGAL